MKKSILIVALMSTALLSCTRAGTLNKLSDEANSQIEVYEYFYEDGNRIFVARFKDCPKVTTTTWQVGNAKYKTYEKAITINP